MEYIVYDLYWAKHCHKQGKSNKENHVKDVNQVRLHNLKYWPLETTSRPQTAVLI